jgi:hypothetical protein
MALCRITGYTNAQIRLHAFRDLSDPLDADIDEPENRDLFEGRIRSYHVEKRTNTPQVIPSGCC